MTHNIQQTNTEQTSIQPMAAQWLDAVCAIEHSAHTHPWADSMLRQTPSKFACNRVLLVDGNVAGYFYAQCVAGEASLLNIAIAPAFQGKGHGKRLLNAFLAEVEKAGAEEGWLEVRESNLAAIALYHSTGFNEIDRRNNYYPTANGREDALVMSYWFDPFSGSGM